jgi:hypothetical protein
MDTVPLELMEAEPASRVPAVWLKPTQLTVAALRVVVPPLTVMGPLTVTVPAALNV